MFFFVTCSNQPISTILSFLPALNFILGNNFFLLLFFIATADASRAKGLGSGGARDDRGSGPARELVSPVSRPEVGSGAGVDLDQVKGDLEGGGIVV